MQEKQALPSRRPAADASKLLTATPPKLLTFASSYSPITRSSILPSAESNLNACAIIQSSACTRLPLYKDLSPVLNPLSPFRNSRESHIQNKLSTYPGRTFQNFSPRSRQCLRSSPFLSLRSLEAALFTLLHQFKESNLNTSTIFQTVNCRIAVELLKINTTLAPATSIPSASFSAQ